MTTAHEVNRRRFLASLGVGAAASGLACGQAPRRPNLLYILADDLGYGDLGCYNPESKAPTPNVDRFASQGVRFTDAHSPSAVCTPTRYGIMTGRYCWRTSLKSGVLWGYSPSLIEPGRMTVASLLKSQGYRTAGFGKWHLGLGNREKTDYDQPLRPGPLDFGFDSFFGIPASLDMEPYVYIDNDRVVARPTEHIDEKLEHRGVFWRGGPIAPGFRHIDVLPTVTAKATAWLRDHGRRHREQPFFQYLALTGPHTPWLPTEKFRGRAKAGEYGDFVTMVDDAIAQVLSTLDESGMARDTLVVVTSDNGAHWLPREIAQWGHRANHFLHGQKADIWDGGHRIPFLARWPGRMQAGATCDETICLTDLLGTMADVTGFRLPRDAGEDSYSILPALLGQKRNGPIREAVVHHSLLGHFSIRKGEWKLILGRGSGGFSEPIEYKPKPGEPEGELFDMARDPSETKNLYLERPEIVASLKALLERYQKQGYSRPMA
jgi:arylsulfatase A-like enzyme